jgi:hypothetical protein
MMRKPAFILITLGLVAAATTGAAWLAQAQHDRAAVYTDGAAIREPASTAPLRRILWQPPTKLPDSINTGCDEYEPKVSPDGQTLYFVRGKAGKNADIYTCQRTPGPPGEVGAWGPPQPLLEINTPDDELGPEPSADGTALYFYSNRPGGLGGYDLWVAHRDSDESGWLAPTNLGPAVNSEYDEYSPALAPNGQTLYFSSNRPRAGEIPPAGGAWPATVRENATRHDYDLYASALAGSEFDPASPLAAINTPADEGCPAISPFGDFLYFASDRQGAGSGSRGGFDLYRARLLRGGGGGGIGPPENLGPEINTPANELDPAPSMGGFALHFSSDRDPPQATAERTTRPAYAIFSTTSREVFREFEPRIASIDWAGLWFANWRKLLWALIALLALALLFLAGRGERGRKLSLLARCLLASLAIHAAIMLITTVVQVAAAVGQAVRHPGTGGGGVKITFAAPGGAGGAESQGSIASQIRGPLTDMTITVPDAPASAAPSVQITSAAATEAHLRVESVRQSDPSPSRLALVALDAHTPVIQKQIPTPSAPDPAATLPLSLPTSPATSSVTEAAPTVQTHQSAAAPASGLRIADATPAPAAILPVLTARQAIDSSAATSLAPTTTAAPLTDPRTTATAATAEQSLAAVAPAPSPEISLPALAGAVPSGSGVPEPGVQISAANSVPVHRAATAVADTSAARHSGSAPLHITPARVGAAVIDASTTFADVAGTAAESTPTSRTGSTPPAPAAVALSALSGLPLPTLEESIPGSRVTAGSAASSAAPTGPSIVGLYTGSAPRAAVPALANAKSPGASSGSPLPGPFRSAIAATPLGGGLGAAPSDAPTTDLPGSSIPGVSSSAPPAIAPSDLLAGLRLPDETAPPDNPYAQRDPDSRKSLVDRMGGSEETERAVASALKWLAAHQAPDGRWSSGHFDDRCGECGGGTKIDSDTAVTGLALLCFLGAGHTHDKDGDYKNNVDRGLDWLLARQDTNGDLRGGRAKSGARWKQGEPGETMYSQGIATIALSEAFGMTHDERLRVPVQRAVRFIAGARSEADGAAGGWRYEPGDAGDTSVLGWQVMALVSAKRSGLDVPSDALQAAKQWLDVVSFPRRPGLYAYQPGRPPTMAMTAEAMFVRQLLGADPADPALAASAAYVAATPPVWKKDGTTYAWYYATLALFQEHGPRWEAWNKALTQQLLSHQRPEGTAAGSWDPLDRWSLIGGRVYQTSICCLSLEVYYRYLPLYARPGAADEQPSEKPGAAPDEK